MTMQKHEFIPSTVDPVQCAFGIGPRKNWCCLPAYADIHMPDTAKDAQGANTARETCTCGHLEDEHFKYGVPLIRGRCKHDGKDGHYCLMFESLTAAAEREQAHQERCERANRIADEIPTAAFRSLVADGETVTFEFEGRTFQVKEV